MVRHYLVQGRVQGVGFRWYVHREASEIGLRGWVRNRIDGSVEALIIGAEEVVATMIEACRRGPALARVEAVEHFPAEDDGAAGFHERPTI